MHELTVTKSIFDIVYKHAVANGVEIVLVVHLDIGALSDLQSQWLQKYFDRLAQGTLCHGARLVVRQVPAIFMCGDCQRAFEIHSPQEQDFRCPACKGREVSLVSGREYHIRSMEAV